MKNIGVIGLGMMGSTHLDVYAKLDNARVVAVADSDEARRTGRAAAGGNIEGQAKGGFDFASVRQYADAEQLIDDPEVEVVDICLPTPLHTRFAIRALEAGKHVLIEKPLARNSAQVAELIAAAEKAPGRSMCAMCMRFWPGWDWLADAVRDQTFGRVLSAHFRRMTSHPDGRFYADGDACGGAILDLHIHDSDFVRHCFGMPEAVFSRGYSRHTDQTDHVVTQYIYPDQSSGSGEASARGPVVSAEGSWALTQGFGFEMQYTVNFEKATAAFDLGGDPVLTLTEPGKKPRGVELQAGMGYEHELAYFIRCLEEDRAPQVVTLADAGESVRLIEAEVKSVQTGTIVTI